MTMFRDTTMLDFERMPPTVAESIDREIRLISLSTIRERAWKEWAMEQDAMEVEAGGRRTEVTNAN